MFGLSFKKKDIDRQVAEFFCYKATRSVYKAEQHSEFLKVFLDFIKKDSIFDVTRDDLLNFKNYVEGKYESEYLRTSALHSVNGFLSFFRCGMMIRMKIGGRTVNSEAVELVQGFREKGITFRKLAALMKKRGYTDDLKTLHFWAHYNNKKVAK